MNEFERAKRRTEKRLAKQSVFEGSEPVAPVSAETGTGYPPVQNIHRDNAFVDQGPASERVAHIRAQGPKEKAILLGGQRFSVPQRPREGLTIEISCKAFGKSEAFKFFHPNPEAYVAWQDYDRLREILRMALNSRFPGMR